MGLHVLSGRGVLEASHLFRSAMRVLFPSVCLICKARTYSHGNHGGLCEECWPKLRLIEEPCCPILGLPFPHDMGEGVVSLEAIADPPDFDRHRSVAIHEGAARTLVHGLKFGDRPDLAKVMARWMVRAGHDAFAKTDHIVPVPLHRHRLIKRRYNQAAELSRAMAHLTDRTHSPEFLVRARPTRHQIGLGARQRQENVRSAFRVPNASKAMVFGARIVLVDDVYTTGATVNACARVLRKAGAVDICVLTFAMAAPQLISQP